MTKLLLAVRGLRGSNHSRQYILPAPNINQTRRRLSRPTSTLKTSNCSPSDREWTRVTPLELSRSKSEDVRNLDLESELGAHNGQLPKLEELLPPKVEGYPTPTITQDETKNYLSPLYIRDWGVSRLPKASSEEGSRFPAISRTVKFNDFYGLTSFIKTLAEIAREEKHEPVIGISGLGPFTLFLHVQTHSAILPESSPVSLLTGSRKVTGITLRDIRFAIMVEQEIEQYLVDGRGTSIPPKRRGPGSVDDMYFGDLGPTRGSSGLNDQRKQRTRMKLQAIDLGSIMHRKS